MTIFYYADTPCFKPTDATYNLTNKIPYCNETTVRMVTNVNKFVSSNEVKYNSGSQINKIAAYFYSILLIFKLLDY